MSELQSLFEVLPPDDKALEHERTEQRHAAEQQRRNYLESVTLAQLAHEMFFGNWKGFLPATAIRKSRKLMRETVKQLAELGPDASEEDRLRVLRQCIESFNVVDGQLQFIDTEARNDIYLAFEAVSHVCGQRGIAWRCSDSLSLREFLGLAATENSPDHSSLTKIRDRLPLEVHVEVFRLVLQIAAEKNLLQGKTVAVDATTLEANAAMKSIVRHDTGEDWKGYLKRLMQEEGLIGAADDPSDEELRRHDKQRKNKKVSNDEWGSASDPDSRITKMKDGRTHLAYKAENVVDLQTDLVLAAEIYEADNPDTNTLVDSVMEARVHLSEAGIEKSIDEVAADKGYHAAATLELADALSLRTYIPEPQRKHDRRWTDKPPEYQRVVYNNRRRTQRAKGRQLQRTGGTHVCAHVPDRWRPADLASRSGESSQTLAPAGGGP